VQSADVDITRRVLLARTAAFAALLSLNADGIASAAESATLTERERACRDFYLYGLAALEMLRARARTMGPSANVFRHVRALATAASRRVTTPNNDTLYSSAWLNLRGGPIEIAIPATESRYFSLALMDLHSNNFHIIGTRVTRGEAHRIRLLPPDVTPKHGEVRAPTWWVWAQARTLVESAADLPAAHAVQDAITLDAPMLPATAAPALLAPPFSAAPVAQLAAMARLLDTEAPPAKTDQRFLARLRHLGLTTSALAAPDAEMTLACERGIAEARRQIGDVIDAAPIVDGWIYARPSIGDFGTDYLYRAAIAVWGLAALPMVEAIYVRAAGPGPQASFDGARAHRIRFDRDRVPPVSAFWSLSLYELMPSGELFFFDNALQRFAIGDRTPGLQFASDGSLEIHISADEPTDARRSNWLPCPRGAFVLILRAYLPAQRLIEGRYRVPPVIPV